MNSAMSIKQRNKPGDNFQSPIVTVAGSVDGCLHPLHLYGYNNNYNHYNEDCDGKQDSGHDVEAAGSGGVVSGTLQISSHLAVSSLGGPNHNHFFKEMNAQHQGNYELITDH